MCKLNPREFLSDAAELHALVIGLGEIVPPLPPRFRSYSPSLEEELYAEYHYYMLGRIFGVGFWCLIILGFKELIL